MGYPQTFPVRPPRSWLGPILATLLILAVLISVGGAAGTVIAAGAGVSDSTAVFVEQTRQDVRDAAVRSLLDRRATAVREKNKTAFLADVDRADPTFVTSQEQEYANLTALPLVEFRYELADRANYDALVAPALRQRYHSVVHGAGVDLLYRIDGLDDKPVAAPWAPVFALADGVWRLVGDVTSAKGLPLGANGQPWDGGPIVVARSARVVAILSANDSGRSAALLRMAETALDRVAAVRNGGWAGKVLVTAVQDTKVFQTYFGESPDRINEVAAIAVPYFSEVPAWHSRATYAAHRVVFNPQQLGVAGDAELLHDLTHEFTHAATGPVTSGATPLWLVEGFAEYVAFKPEQVRASWLRKELAAVPAGLPANGTFYSDALNYVAAWQACRMIAERYGEAKLMALYEAFREDPSVESAVKRTLGVDQATLTRQVNDHLDQLRAST